MKKQSIYFLVIIILLVQTSCQQNNEEEDFFNNQITLLENNPRLYLSKIDSTQVTNLNNSKEATHFLLVSLANYYVNNYYPPKEVLQKSIHIFTKKKLIQQQLESLLFLAKTYKKEKNLKMEVQAIEKAIDIASQIEDKEWLCCLYGYLGDMYIRKYNMLKFIKYQTLANQCIEDIAFRDMDISTQVQTAKSFLYIGNHKKSYELLNLIESSIDKNNIYYNEIKCLQGITLFKTKQWALCIEKLQEAIILSQTDDFLFVCHSILTYCYYSINDLANANKHRKLAIEYDTDSETNFAEIEFYKLCAEFARENNYIDNQIDCLYKAIERHEILLRNLNGSSLDEAIQAYTHFCDKKNYEKKLSTYKYAALSSLFIASIGLLIYINKKRKKAYKWRFEVLSLTLQRSKSINYMIKKGFLLALFAIGVFANIFAQDTLSFKKTRDKNIYIEFLGASNLIGVSFDSRFTPISPWGYRIGISYFQGGDSFIKASNSNRGLFFPIEVNFLTSGNKHKLELGLGSNLGIYNEHISFIEESKEQYETISSTSNTTFGYYFFSNIGYRYISTKGFLFRIGLSPSFSFNDKHGITKEPFIYPYISFGYSF